VSQVVKIKEMSIFNKINNYLLLFLAACIPFFNTFNNNKLFRYVRFEYISFFVLAFFIAHSFFTNKTLLKEQIGKVTIVIVLFFFAQVVSGMAADDFDLALLRLTSELQFTITLLVLNNLINDNDSYESIFKGMAIGFLLSCMIAFLQYLEFSQFYIFTEAELNSNAGLHTGGAGIYNRIWGPFGNSLTFSEYLSIVGISLYVYFRTIKKQVGIAYLFLLLTVVCTSLTYGRTALFTIGFTYLLSEFLLAKGSSSKIATYAISIIALVLVTIFFLIPGSRDDGSALMDRFTKTNEDLRVGRLNLWTKGFSAFQKSPLIGVGPGNLHGALSSEGFPMTSDVIASYEGQHVENYFLTVLYTYGIIGFALCIAIYCYMLSYSYKLFQLLKGKVRSPAYGGVMFSAVVALLINNVTNTALIFDIYLF
jgi:O-antigen ligase